MSFFDKSKLLPHYEWTKYAVMFQKILIKKHGYHRWCLQTFTNNKGLKTFDENQNSTDHCELSGAGIRTSTRVSAAASSSTLFPQYECIFCGKNRKPMRGGLKETLTTCVTYIAKDSSKRSASIKKNFTRLGKIVGVDMVAKQARYHES